MQPIERYGVISLLALVVIITAVVLWDQADDEQPVLAAASKVEQGPAGLNRNAVPPQKPAAKGQVPLEAIESTNRALVDDLAEQGISVAAIVSSGKLARQVIPAARSSEVCNTVITMEPPSDPHSAELDLYGWDAVLEMGD